MLSINRKKANELFMRKIIILIILLLGMIFIEGCASLPRGLRNGDTQLLGECNTEKLAKDNPLGAFFLSVESDAIVETWYLYLASDESQHYLVKLRPKKIGIPQKVEEGWFRFKANEYCYMIPAGNYSIRKIIGQKTDSDTSELKAYLHERQFTVVDAQFTYLGRYKILDSKLDGKGYFGRASAEFSSLFKGMVTGSFMPESIKLKIIDEYDQDSAWLSDTYKDIIWKQNRF